MRTTRDIWDRSDPYEYFMGRWSQLMAPVFLEWLNFPINMSWLDIGCGTGALSEAIYHGYKPANLSCIDPSTKFLVKAKEMLSDKGDFMIGSASNIPKSDSTFDIVVSGLALNFFPDIRSAFTEMKRVLKSNGTIAAYVWDYADRMDFLRLFWDAACRIDPEARKYDEGIRFQICNIKNLRDKFQEAGLSNIKTSFLDITTVFKNFADYWNPFMGGQGPAPSYLASLTKNLQEKIKSNLLTKLDIGADGSIKLLARALAIRGIYN
jgi:ubiquinone/menaquinone biosynthesis C-methylase UbiE